MIAVSESARITLGMVLETLLEEEKREGGEFAGVPSENLGLRLGLSASQNVAFRLDLVREGDQVVRHEGKNVLLVDSVMAERFDRALLDCVDTPSGPRLTISR